MFLRDDNELYVVFASGYESGKWTVNPSGNPYASKFMLVKFDTNDSSSIVITQKTQNSGFGRSATLMYPGSTN